MSETAGEQRAKDSNHPSRPTAKLIIVGAVFMAAVIACSVVATYLVLRNLPAALTREIIYRQNSELEKANACISAAVDRQTRQLDMLAERAEKQLNDTVSALPQRYERTIANASESSAAGIKTRYDELQRQLSSVQRQLETAANERQNRAQAFFKAARDTKDIQAAEDRVRLLYLIALDSSRSKTEGIKEYLDWQNTLMQKELKAARFNDASARIAAAAATLDRILPSGTLDDIQSEDVFKSYLDGMKAALEKVRDPVEKEQMRILAEIEAGLKTMKAEDADGLNGRLDALKASQLPGISGRAAELETAVNARAEIMRGCVALPGRELVPPPLEYPEYWNIWLDSLYRRMKDDSISARKRLEALSSANDFMAVVSQKACGDRELAAAAGEIEAESRLLAIKYWQERARQLAGNKTLPAAAAELINEAEQFNSDDKAHVKDFMKDLTAANRMVLNAAVQELGSGLRNLEQFKDKFSSAENFQLASALQGQCLQMALRCSELNCKYANAFEQQSIEIMQLHNCARKLTHEFRNYLAVKEMRQAEEQRDRYLKWARDTIDFAQGQYKECADTRMTRWGNKEIQRKLSNAWNELKKIHPDDLNSVNPVEFKKYQEIKEKIETQYNPSDDERRNFKFMRLSDFARNDQD